MSFQENAKRLVSDAFYVTLGLGVIGFQRMQVRRQEFLKSVKTTLKGAEPQVIKAKEGIKGALDTLESSIEKQEEAFDQVIERAGKVVPTPIIGAISEARKVTGSIRQNAFSRAKNFVA